MAAVEDGDRSDAELRAGESGNQPVTPSVARGGFGAGSPSPTRRSDKRVLVARLTKLRSYVCNGLVIHCDWLPVVDPGPVPDHFRGSPFEARWHRVKPIDGRDFDTVGRYEGHNYAAQATTEDHR